MKLKIKDLTSKFEPSFCFFYGMGCRNPAIYGVLGDGLNLLCCKECMEMIKLRFGEI